MVKGGAEHFDHRGGPGGNFTPEHGGDDQAVETGVEQAKGERANDRGDQRTAARSGDADHPTSLIGESGTKTEDQGAQQCTEQQHGMLDTTECTTNEEPEGDSDEGSWQREDREDGEQDAGVDENLSCTEAIRLVRGGHGQKATKGAS